VRPYSEADAAKWDELVGRSATGTFLHTRRFLSYHGNRFADLSLVCEDAKQRVVGVFPAAAKPGDRGCVVSHPGATYGGLLVRDGGGAAEIEQMVDGILAHYRAAGLTQLEYRSVPPHLHASFSQVDLHAIWKRGAEVARRDLWSVISLRERPRYSKGHKWAIGRAKKGGVVVRAAAGEAAYRAFHAMLESRLEERHGVSPVHTAEELLMLRDRFPRNIALWLAHDGEGKCLAGCWIFMFGTKAWHTQYIASTAEGRDRCATHLVADRAIETAVKEGVAFFSFGASTEAEGRQLNAGLFGFKAAFGAGAVCHDIYVLRLN
jgi:hypothetical protein